MQHNNQPSIISVNLQAPCEAFVAQLTTANGQRPGILRMRQQERIVRLDQQWEVLFHLAQSGMEPQLAALLGTFLEEWAAKEAIELILQNDCNLVDPTHPVLLEAFWGKLGRQHQALSSELLLYLEQGRREREQQEAHVQSGDLLGAAHNLLEEQERAAGFWLQQGNQTLANLQQQTQDGHQFALDWQQRASDEYWQGHNVAQGWSNQALSAVQQAQQGVQKMYDFAEKMEAHVVNLAEVTSNHANDMLPSVATEAASQVVSQRRQSRLFVVIVVLLVFLGFLALGFVLSVTLP